MSLRVVMRQTFRGWKSKQYFCMGKGSKLESSQVNWGLVGGVRTFGSGVGYRGIHGSSQVGGQLEEGDSDASGVGGGSGKSTAAARAALTKVQTENRKMIAKLLGIKEDEVTRIPGKLIIEEKALHTLDVLKEFGFSPSSSIHLYPELLIMSGGAVENYIRIMQESGFPDVREVFIVRFRTVSKQSLSVLQRKISIPDVHSIVERYCAEVEAGDEFLTEFVGKLPKDTEKLTLFNLRNDMMGRYFSKILLGSLDDSMKAFTKYPRLYYRCFNWVKRNFKILKDFGFSNEKIKSHFYLLHTDPKNLSRITTEIKSLAGLEMKKIGHLRPKILMSTYDTLIDIENSFIKHDISFESVQKYLEVYTLSASTIRQRLEEMDTIPEFQLLKTHPRVARLLYYQNKAKSRLEDFRTLQIRGPSLHLLSTDTKRFNRSVAGDFRIRGVDVMIYLSDILQIDKQRIRDSLVRHPHWLHISVVNIKSVLKFLQSVGSFSTDQLVEAVPILLYPKEKVEKEFENVVKSGEAKLQDDYFLQMVLYYLERPVHFTGDGVWPEKVPHQELDDDEGQIQKTISEVKK